MKCKNLRNFPERAKFDHTVMEPLTPNDPIWKLLGKARPVETRGNFTRNVLRAVRGMPQDHGWFAAVRIWMADTFDSWQRQALAGAVAVAVVLIISLSVVQTPAPTATQPEVAAAPATTQLDEDLALIANEVEQPLEGLDHMDALVAMDDTSALSDREIAFLLY